MMVNGQFFPPACNAPYHKLGVNQKGVLNALREHEYYLEGRCGWCWDTHSNTKRILESLVKKGLVSVKNGTYKLNCIFVEEPN